MGRFALNEHVCQTSNGSLSTFNSPVLCPALSTYLRGAVLDFDCTLVQLRGLLNRCATQQMTRRLQSCLCVVQVCGAVPLKPNSTLQRTALTFIE